MKKSFELLYSEWQILIHHISTLPSGRETFAFERDKLIQGSGWTKQEFYTAIDDYNLKLYEGN